MVCPLPMCFKRRRLVRRTNHALPWTTKCGHSVRLVQRICMYIWVKSIILIQNLKMKFCTNICAYMSQCVKRRGVQKRFDNLKQLKQTPDDLFGVVNYEQRLCKCRFKWKRAISLDRLWFGLDLTSHNKADKKPYSPTGRRILKPCGQRSGRQWLPSRRCRCSHDGKLFGVRADLVGHGQGGRCQRFDQHKST
jgi:hypothetical protein